MRKRHRVKRHWHKHGMHVSVLATGPRSSLAMTSLLSIEAPLQVPPGKQNLSAEVGAADCGCGAPLKDPLSDRVARGKARKFLPGFPSASRDCQFQTGYTKIKNFTNAAVTTRRGSWVFLDVEIARERAGHFWQLCSPWESTQHICSASRAI